MKFCFQNLIDFSEPNCARKIQRFSVLTRFTLWKRQCEHYVTFHKPEEEMTHGPQLPQLETRVIFTWKKVKQQFFFLQQSRPDATRWSCMSELRGKGIHSYCEIDEFTYFFKNLINLKIRFLLQKLLETHEGSSVFTCFVLTFHTAEEEETTPCMKLQVWNWTRRSKANNNNDRSLMVRVDRFPGCRSRCDVQVSSCSHAKVSVTV